MEQCWHNQLAFGGDLNGCTIRELFTTPTPDQMESGDVTVPKFTRTVTFARNDMRDLKELQLGDYCMPITPNFPTVDSLACLQNPFCDPDNGNKCLVGFQMTVNTSGHSLNLDGGQLVRRKFKELFNLGDPLSLANMYIVFVTTKAAEPSFKKKQPWVTNRGNQNFDLEGVRQFVLVLPEN